MESRSPHPEIIFRGVPFIEEKEGLVDEMQAVVDDTLDDASRRSVREPALIQEDLHDEIAKAVYKSLKRRPMVLPVVVET